MSIDDRMDDDFSLDDLLLDSFDPSDEKVQEKKKEPTPPSQSDKKEPPVVLEKSFPEEPKKEEVRKEPRVQAEDALALAGRLEMWNKSCRDLFLDLRVVTFTATEEEMFLECQDKSYFSKPLYFKSDPQKPKDPKVVHAQKQFCKFVGIPHGFFMNNRPQLKMEVVRTWQSGLIADDSKGRCIARIREAEDYCSIRAMVPENYALIPNHELIGIINKSIIDPQKNDPNLLEFAMGDERDDLQLHARYLFGDKFDVCGQTMSVGFSVVASELGGSPLIVEALIHMVESKTSFVASYGAEPFMKSKYEGIQPQQIKDVFPKLIERITQELPEMISRIVAINTEVDPREECLRVNSWKGLPSKFKRSLFHELEGRAEDMATKLDFARHMSLIAKDFDFQKRLSVERAAGEYLNLMFSKT